MAERQQHIEEMSRIHSRTQLGQELLRLGPLKLIDGLRLAQISFRSELSITQAESDMRAAGLVDDDQKGREQHIALLNGYLNDREEWDQILDEISRGE